MREAYGFLCHNYHPGDTIHLFGFSRGAYTARSICGLVCRIGLLTKLGMDDFYTIYHNYQTGDMTDQYIANLQARENGEICRANIEVTTIGCFDTVGSLGIPRLNIPLLDTMGHLGVPRLQIPLLSYWLSPSGLADVGNYPFHDTDLSPRVRYAFHALGLDEQRQPFSPTLWFKPPSNTTTELRQCWFPGVHSDVGGGYSEQEIADMTLAWMVERTKEQLDWDPVYLHHIIKNSGNDRKEWAASDPHESHKGIMRLGGMCARTPGFYKSPTNPDSDTAEFMHVSVRVRRQVKSEKNCVALQDWQWKPEKKCWVNTKDPSKCLKEDWLGDTEMELAGRDVVERLLKRAFPSNVDGAQLSPGSSTGK